MPKVNMRLSYERKSIRFDEDGVSEVKWEKKGWWWLSI